MAEPAGATTRPALERLLAVLGGLDRVAVAVSGGVDSMVLAYHAAQVLGAAATAFHAVSPAVPPEASERVRRYAARFGWRLEVVDAHEFDDPDYLANPVDRCFFCKTNLYRAIARHTEAQMLSGANLDDLGDYRPGLVAAREHGVRHPLVEAGVDKATVRLLARAAGLDDLAELPAAPCLSSRITTGVPVTAERLGLVYQVERLLAERFGGDRTIRCRVEPAGVEVQLDPASLAGLGEAERARLSDEIARLCGRYGVEGGVRFAPYVRGSAFLHSGERRGAG